MGMARHSNPTVREGGVEKLSMAALLAPEHPALLIEPLENLTNFHATTVPRRTRAVNAERRRYATAAGSKGVAWVEGRSAS
jgi:hypothetical protein